MAFKIGQKVVCVDNAPSWGTVSEMDGLEIGIVYTIRDFIAHQATGEIGIRLCEIRRKVSGADQYEQPYWHRRFRPVIERKTETGMAVLREILGRESHDGRVTDAERQRRKAKA